LKRGFAQQIQRKPPSAVLAVRSIVAKPPSSCVFAPLLVTGIFFSPFIVPSVFVGVWIDTG
jgi:hypothetical protein